MNRKQLEEILGNEASQEKHLATKRFLQQNNSLRDYHFIFQKILRYNQIAKSSCQIAILSSFTFDQLKEILIVENFSRGIQSNVLLGGFNQYQQLIYTEESPLYTFNPSVILLAVRIDELFENFLWLFHSYSSKQRAEEIEKILTLYDSLITTLRDRCSAQIFIDNFVPPDNFVGGNHESQEKHGRLEWIKTLNRSLLELTKQHSGVFIFDINNITSGFGRDSVYDAKMWYTSRIPYTQTFIKRLGVAYSRHIHSLYNRKKCLVLDLDNTLWGGVIGEDGINGIELGKTYPGNVFVDIQKTVKLFAQQGIILALNSKNNRSDAKEVFENHPDMILQWDDFAATRINWNPKPQNIVELAEEINIGLDSIVFVDDNPFETEMVKEALPEVEIIQFAKNPLHNLALLKNTSLFDTLSITKEDAEKVELYKGQNKRNQLRKNTSNIEDYYRGLSMQVTIQECDAFSVKRIAQLTQKTNQFNFTTRRYSERDINQLCESPLSRVYSMAVQDKFGDNGLTGAIIISITQKRWVIDTFLLSCRVIGRTLETALLSFVLDEAKHSGANELIGEFIPTAKNTQVANLYKEYGFTFKDGFWYLSTGATIQWPDWIKATAP